MKTTKSTMTRREFAKAIALGACATAVTPLWAADPAPARKLKIGHTGITWGVFPQNASRPTSSDNLEPFLKDISSQGFYSFECFPQNLADWEAKGKLGELLDKYKVPLASCYYTANVIDSSKRKETLDEIVKHAKLVKKYNGRFLVLAAGGGRGANYDFNAVRQNIVESFNEYGKAIADLGLDTGLHQHTGTPVDSRDEVYYVMEKVDTKVFRFAPDVGQLQKAGADAAKVIKDFASITVHMHLKDWTGWKSYSGYCPLGQGKIDSKAILTRADIDHDLLKNNPGKVDIKTILDIVEANHPEADVMVELDPNGPLTPLETVQFSKAYLKTLGYTFKT